MRYIYIILLIVFLPFVSYAAPTSYDWRDVSGVNYVTSVKDQGTCGSCWAFAVTAALESQAIKAGLINLADADFSEQTLLSCSTAGDCTSGSSQTASTYIKNTGLPIESCFPYVDSKVECVANACAGYQTTTYRFTDWDAISEPTATQVKDAIYTYGPIVADIKVYYDLFDHYTSGIYTWDGVHTYKTGHDVLVVGYDDTESYFICKNTRGDAWGESGYFRIAYSELKSQGGTSAFCTLIIYYYGAISNFKRSIFRP